MTWHQIWPLLLVAAYLVGIYPAYLIARKYMHTENTRGSIREAKLIAIIWPSPALLSVGLAIILLPFVWLVEVVENKTKDWRIVQFFQDKTPVQ